MVERLLAKEKVTGSNPVARSIEEPPLQMEGRFCVHPHRVPIAAGAEAAALTTDAPLCYSLLSIQAAHDILCVAMNDPVTINRDAILAYLEGARHAVQGAHYNLSGGYFGIAVSRAYYAFFYAATALLLTLDVSRSKHTGVMAAFREHFVKSGIFPIQDSRAYGETFELRNVADYEMLAEVDEPQARTAVESAEEFVGRSVTCLATRGYL